MPSWEDPDKSDPIGDLIRMQDDIARGDFSTMYQANLAKVRELTKDTSNKIAETSAREFLESLNAWSEVEEHHRAKTPARMVKMFQQMTTREDFEFTTFPAKSQDMITLGPIPFYALCAHHTAPFMGVAHVGYVPEATIAGLSKFARTVKERAKGFWVQEELTHDIASFIEGHLQPKGVAVVLRAEHLCLAMRGVQQPGVITTTSAMLGVFGDHSRTAKAEFMSIIGGH